jgi:hypothetical protein
MTTLLLSQHVDTCVMPRLLGSKPVTRLRLQKQPGERLSHFGISETAGSAHSVRAR